MTGQSGRTGRPVAVVTGAGRGLGRGHALRLAGLGYAVVVNDVGVGLDGAGCSDTPAHDVVEEILAGGGSGAVSNHDVATWEGAAELVGTALREFGRLDVLVNNAGIIRDRMLVNMSDEDWDDVTRVHLRGTFAPLREASRHWRARSKAGDQVDARIINTTSTSGLFGNLGQANYGAGKAGAAALTVIAAMELERYGVAVNAVAPGARTRMTEGLLDAPVDGSDPYDPAAVSELVAWLAEPGARGITGQVFFVQGGCLSLLTGWRSGPTVLRDRPVPLGELDGVVDQLLHGGPDVVLDHLLEGERR